MLINLLVMFPTYSRFVYSVLLNSKSSTEAIFII